MFPPSAPARHERASTWLLRQIEWRQFGLLTRQLRAGTYAGAAVIVMTLLLAPSVAGSALVAGIALLRMALFVHDNMLARTLQEQIAADAPRRSTVWRLILHTGLANMVWGALTWPLDMAHGLDLMTFLVALIALFSICLSIVSASFHPATLAAATLGGCLGLAPKVQALAPATGLLLPLGFLIYFITIHYFAGQLGRQARGGIALEIRRRRIAGRLAQTNTALERALVHAHRLADQDSLTRLRNRRALEQATTTLMASWPTRQVFVLLIDVDHFKRINDRFGHAMGDGVLVAIGTALNQWEIEADGRLAGRWGGEEFIAVAALDHPGQAGALADELRERIAELGDVLHWPGKITLSASIGCAPLASTAQFDEALRRADAALYAAKRAGRNCWKLAA